MRANFSTYPAASCFESSLIFKTTLMPCAAQPTMLLHSKLQHCHPKSECMSAAAVSLKSIKHPDLTAWHLSMPDHCCAHTHNSVLLFRLWQDIGVCAAHQGQGRQSEREWAQTCHHLFGSKGLAGAAGMLALDAVH